MFAAMTADLSHIAAGHEHDSHRSRWGAKVPVTISDSYVSLGWWMVMSDDEQGYAPAVYLEPVEENSSDKDVHPEDSIDEGMYARESPNERSILYTVYGISDNGPSKMGAL